MKLMGDVPEKDREHAKALSEMELDVENNSKIPASKLAQMYVCLAHDWFQLDMEEEGNRLLIKAERVCPGYFKTFVIQHQKEDELFDRLIRNITVELISMLVATVKEEQ